MKPHYIIKKRHKETERLFGPWNQGKEETTLAQETKKTTKETLEKETAENSQQFVSCLGDLGSLPNREISSQDEEKYIPLPAEKITTKRTANSFGVLPELFDVGLQEDQIPLAEKLAIQEIRRLIEALYTSQYSTQIAVNQSQLFQSNLFDVEFIDSGGERYNYLYKPKTQSVRLNGHVFQPGDAFVVQMLRKGFFKGLNYKEINDRKKIDDFYKEGQALYSLRKHAEKLGMPYVYAIDKGNPDQKEFPFIVMEFLPGGELEFPEHLELEDKIKILIDICQKLEAQHQVGIIHRDIKPSNIMYNPEKRESKIIDYGISNLVLEKLNTKDGVGTGLYTCPRQIDGETCPQVDIYSFGVTLYKLFMGKDMFERRDNQLQYLAHHIMGKFEFDNQKVPPQIQKIILKCMERKTPSSTFQSQQPYKSFQEVTAGLKKND